MYRIGADVGGTKINVGILNNQSKIVCREKFPVPQNTGCDGVLLEIKNGVDRLLLRSGIKKDEIGFCGMGVPGTVSGDCETAVKVPNLGWENEPVARKFEALCGIRPKLVQDSRAAAYGEYRLGGGRGRKCVLCVTLGTGIGTGIVLDGKIFHGILGGAGELGHAPAVPGGRACGCGRSGCVEKYAAGGGLDATAKELYGSGATARTLFQNAENGDEAALETLRQAVTMLGSVLVSAVNLLSPDCILFSGGLIAQKNLYAGPLMQYIREHSYGPTVEGGMEIKIAELGEDSPMIGAALLGETGKPAKLSASLMCADWLNMRRDLDVLAGEGVDYLHCDVMDGHFVPNLMMPPDLMAAVGRCSSIPLDIHLMVERPEQIVPMLTLKKGDIVSVHCEAAPHLQAVLAAIRARGASAAVALNPSTPIETIRDVLPDIDMALVMTVNPGFAGQTLIPQTLDKIARLRKMLDELGYSRISIEVDGNCSFENIPKMRKAGADIFIVGSSSVFDPSLGVTEAIKRLRNILIQEV